MAADLKQLSANKRRLVALRLRLRNAGLYRKRKHRRFLRHDDPGSNVAKQQGWKTDGGDEPDEPYKCRINS